MAYDKQLNEALTHISEVFGEQQKKMVYGLQESDNEGIIIRGKLFTTFIENFVGESKRRATQQRIFRIVFFCAVLLTFFTLNVLSVMVIYEVSLKIESSYTDAAAVAAALGTVISTLIILPKIIAVHLFPSTEQDKSIELFTKVLEEDRKMREMYKINKGKE